LGEINRDSGAGERLHPVDYYLWALQRFYERQEDRYLEAIWPQTKRVHDLDDVRDAGFGAIYTQSKPLTRETRFGERKKMKKGRRI